eukprot:5164761-Ditylum_brightwellii.AAC.1
MEVREENLRQGRDEIASEEEIISEIDFFEKKKKEMYSDDDIAKLKKATQILQLQWHTQRCREKKIASTTPKMHNLLFHLIPQATYLGRFFHFMEDPIESLHRKDKELNRIFAVATSCKKREN